MDKIDILFELLKRSKNYQLKSFIEFAEAYEGDSEEVVNENIERVEREHENIGGWL